MTNPTQPKPGAQTYSMPADLMHAIVNTLATMPWGQINGVMAPAVTLMKQQDDAVAAGAAGQTGMQAPARSSRK